MGEMYKGDFGDGYVFQELCSAIDGRIEAGKRVGVPWGRSRCSFPAAAVCSDLCSSEEIGPCRSNELFTERNRVAKGEPWFI